MLLRMFCVCQDKQAVECEGCLCRRRCIVQNIMYAPFKIKPDFVTEGESAGFRIYCGDKKQYVREGDNLSFEMILFGDMMAYFNPILQAVHALGIEGLGREHVPFSIETVYNQLGDKIVDGMDVHVEYLLLESIDDFVRKRKAELKNCDTIRLSFNAPCDIRFHGQMQREFSPKPILQAAYRRLYMASLFEGIDIERVWDSDNADAITYEQSSKRMGLKRYSGRKEEKINLYGITGWIDMQNVSEEAMEVLLVGELTGIGKNIKFGMGNYRVEGKK